MPEGEPNLEVCLGMEVMCAWLEEEEKEGVFSSCSAPVALQPRPAEYWRR